MKEQSALALNERHAYLFMGENYGWENSLSLMRRLSALESWLKSREATGVSSLAAPHWISIYWVDGPSLLEAKVKFPYVSRECDLKN